MRRRGYRGRPNLTMRTFYHEFESLEHLLSARLLPGGENQPIRCVIFGGTGAVGGAVVLDLCQLILMSRRFRSTPLRGEIYATGSSDKEITQFARRLYLALGETVEIEKVQPLRHYRLNGHIDLHFSLLRLEILQDLGQHVTERLGADSPPARIEAVLGEYFDAQDCPFLRFVEAIGSELLHAVIVSIPLPSVATYTLEAIDQLTVDRKLDHKTHQRLKSLYLRTFIRGLAVVQQRHARHVVIAHTTAVGGMYRVDGGAAEIRLGFAHSALGKRLVDKKYFADELTHLYVDHGFDVLVTAAAIGIDSVEFHSHLPLDRGAQRALAARAKATPEAPPIDPADLGSGRLRLYPSRILDLECELSEPDATVQPVSFGAGKDLIVEAAIRSGENGLFSVANCVALYNVMKVAIPEELAMVLVRHAIFGPERRRDWFVDKICYYAETENSYFALRLLDSYPQLVHAHLGAFALQAYQALGSSTHQARLHELGLVVLLLRLLDLGRGFREIPEPELLDGLGDLDAFLWRRSRLPSFEDLEPLTPERLAELLGMLCEIETNEDAGHLIGYDFRRYGMRPPGREKFLARLATRIRRYLSSITSLGIPILYRSPSTGRDRVLVGPYVAPLELAVGASDDLGRVFARLAAKHGLGLADARDWVIVNNGFVDLRPHALATTAKEPGPHLAQSVWRFQSAEEILAWQESLPVGCYFTTGGLVALKLRLDRLFAAVRRRKIELGTRETWKHLFQQDLEGRHVLTPGLVETVRMYSEGQGKVTGTEALWPHWGY